MAILSSCIFSHDAEKFNWKGVREHGKRLGVDLKELKKAFDNLPKLQDTQVKGARSLMDAAGEAVRELRAKQLLEDKVRELQTHRDPHEDMVKLVETEFRTYFETRTRETAGIPLGTGDHPARSTLISVIVDLVSSKPNLPYSVRTLAAAARMTPNHFSSLFSSIKGQRFSDFLAEQRIEMAKELLSDLTKNIGEIADDVGYEDAGYFARRFRQLTGQSPREWRESFASRPVTKTDE